MIKFEVEFTETGGAITISVATPPARASAREIEVGMAFKEMISQWMPPKCNRSMTLKPWEITNLTDEPLNPDRQ